MAATAVGKTSFFTLSNVIGSLEDIEIAIDAPTGDSVPAQVTEVSKGTFKVEFCPSVAGEHQIYVSFGSEPVPGSPFPCKVYNVSAIQVRECKKGIVGKPVTFLVETSQAGPGNLEVTGEHYGVITSVIFAQNCLFFFQLITDKYLRVLRPRATTPTPYPSCPRRPSPTWWS